MKRAFTTVVATAVSGIAVIGAPIIGPPADVAVAVSSTDIVGAPGGEFGRNVLVLPNGNLVVTDPGFDLPGKADVGAISLYNGFTAALISTVTGGSANDRVGAFGGTVVGGTNFVVLTRNWRNAAMLAVGAVTWINGATGLNGVVSASNSLVGSTDGDFLATSITVLANGNYVVDSPYWDNGGPDFGAATWASGATGVRGTISAANSLVGSYAFDYVGGGLGVTALTNGHYVVASPVISRNGGVTKQSGAATWGNGAVGTVGAVTDANSIYGTKTDDFVGTSVTALTNGNYVIGSSQWTNNTGAVTWAKGDGSTVGAVQSLSTMVGGQAGDAFGLRIAALPNGNYVASSPEFHVGGTAGVGAVRWGNGNGGTSGVVSNLNSIVGSRAGDGETTNITVLSNSNYVVSSPLWDSATATDVGAVTWASGAGVSSFNVSIVSSLVGTTNGDNVGAVTPLTNGNYIVTSTGWDGAAADVGAVTWGSGSSGVKGSVSGANSLVGTRPGDAVGSRGAVPLSNGNYVVLSSEWDNGPTVGAGAATWGNGSTGTVGAVSVANSLVGTRVNDQVGTNATALTNGNVVIASRMWHDAGGVAVGALTWASGASATAGSVAATNSVVGTRADDFTVTNVVALDNGGYVLRMPRWDNGAAADAGAMMWASGVAATSATVSPANSLVGSTAGDQVGSGGFRVLPNGYVVIASSSWDNGAAADVGAVTLGYPSGVRGVVSAANSVIGSTPAGGIHMSLAAAFLPSGALAIGRPADNRVTLLAAFDFVPLTPARLADTRADGRTVDGVAAGIGQLGAATTLELPVAGRAGVPPTAVAVALNVTVTEPAVELFVTVFPCGRPRPTASNLNAAAGMTVPNAAVSRLGTGGAVCIYASQGTHLVVDLTGYFPSASSFRALDPARVIDTRPGETTGDGLQAGGGRLAPGATTEIQIGGRVGVTANAGTVVLNVTVTGADIAGFVTVYPCGEPRPLASSLNVNPGLTAANLVVAKLGTGGNVCVYNQSAVHLVADVSGYFPTDTNYASLVPARLLDTRAASGLQAGGTTVAVRVAGRAGVTTDAATAVLNVTVTEPAVAGFVTVYPCGIDRPLASNLNYAAGQTIPNAVIVSIGTAGEVCLFTSQTTHLVVDVNGYFTR